MIGRRSFVGGVSSLLALGGALRSARALATSAPSTEYFVLVQAAGGWDVTLWSDPRFERKGSVVPGSTATLQTNGLRLWKDAPFERDDKTFAPIGVRGGSAQLGPAAGDLVDVFDRVALINGIAMSSVSHLDGAAFASTGQHLVGGRPVASSIDAVLGHAFGLQQMLPVVSIRFPSSYLAGRLDPRAIPVEAGDIDALGRALRRREIATTTDDQDDVSVLLRHEGERAASRQIYAQRTNAMVGQFDAMSRLAKQGIDSVVGLEALRKAMPKLPWSSRASGATHSAAFAVEAMKRDLVRVAAFSMIAFDTHSSNYRFHALALQDFFAMIVGMMRAFDETPHPTLPGHKMSDHVHMLVFSEFCRTPQINLGGGRDHYPNNSMLIVSPRVKGGVVHGRTDPGELLPVPTRKFALGERAVAPPDVLATFLRAVGVDHAPYVRDGEVLDELLVRA